MGTTKTITDFIFQKRGQGTTMKCALMMVPAGKAWFKGYAEFPHNKAWFVQPKFYKSLVGTITHETIHVVLNRTHVHTSKCRKTCKRGLDPDLQFDFLDDKFVRYARLRTGKRDTVINTDGFNVYTCEYISKWHKEHQQ